MALVESRTPLAADDPNRDLGFGAVVARESRKRLVNKDGSFNVVREGLSFFRSLSPYHYLLTTSWPRFLGLIVVSYMVINAAFGAAYFACGPGQIEGSKAVSLPAQYLEDFFFSVQTFATIGYGAMHPEGLAANVLVTLESLVGLLGFALATGILFARFSQPTARILFSDKAIIAPYQQINAFEFRVANIRRNEMIQVEVVVMLTRLKQDGTNNREFIPLKLERDKVVFFPLAWTIVHPIDEASPLFGATRESLQKCDVEVLILFSGIDEIFSQRVHTRSSYKAQEIVWGARFTNLFNPPRPDGTLSIDIGRLHDVELVGPKVGASDP
ncbi:MAG TPA: ion channel [Thermoanaerobaculia bacterium]|jgi:inward rectifier potassium channel|nr:ion channel [Thermoanaerobaculia bacterium]